LIIRLDGCDAELSLDEQTRKDAGSGAKLDDGIPGSDSRVGDQQLDQSVGIRWPGAPVRIGLLRKIAQPHGIAASFLKVVEWAFRGKKTDVGKPGFQLLKMSSNGGVDDDRPVATGRLHFPNPVTESFEATTDLRSTKIHQQLIAFGIGHDESPARSISVDGSESET